MGRHRSPQNDVRISKEAIIAIIAVVALVIAVAAWLFVRNSDSEDQAAAGKCPKGDIKVPYAVIGNVSDLTTVFSDFQATNPVVQDNCVVGVEKTSLDKARAFGQSS